MDMFSLLIGLAVGGVIGIFLMAVPQRQRRQNEWNAELHSMSAYFQRRVAEACQAERKLSKMIQLHKHVVGKFLPPHLYHQCMDDMHEVLTVDENAD